MKVPILFRASVVSAAIVAISLIASLAAPFARDGDPGVGWHLTTGQLVLGTGIPRVDPFLFGDEVKTWISNQWFADAILRCAQLVGGWPLLDYLVVLIGGLALTLTLLRLNGTQLSTLSLFAGFPLLLALGSVQWIVRPVVFSFLCFSAVLVLCHFQNVGQLRTSRFLICIAGIFTIWANLHPAFMLGFVPLGGMVFAAGCTRQKGKLSVACAVLAVAAIATCINPYGIELHRAALGLVSDPFFMQLNSEWRPAEFRRFPYIILPCLVALLLVTPVAFERRPIFERFTICVLLILSFTARRYISFLVIALAPVVLIAIHQWVRKLLGGSALKALTCDQELNPKLALQCWAVVAVLFVSGAILGKQEGGEGALGLDQHYPKAAVDFLAPSIEDKHIFHTPDWGGYLTWRFFPKRVATIDDRNELNGKAAYEEFLQIARANPGWRTVLRERGYTHVLTAPITTLAGALEGDKGWQEVFRDDKAVVFARRTGVSDALGNSLSTE